MQNKIFVEWKWTKSSRIMFFIWEIPKLSFQKSFARMPGNSLDYMLWSLWPNWSCFFNVDRAHCHQRRIYSFIELLIRCRNRISSLLFRYAKLAGANKHVQNNHIDFQIVTVDTGFVLLDLSNNKLRTVNIGSYAIHQRWKASRLAEIPRCVWKNLNNGHESQFLIQWGDR